MKIRHTHHTPLLLRQAHIGKVTNAYRRLLIEELCPRGIVVQRMELITKTKAIVISRECPNPIKKENPKEKEAKKCLHPKLLTAAYLSKDVIGASLEKINVMRSSRLQCIIC